MKSRNQSQASFFNFQKAIGNTNTNDETSKEEQGQKAFDRITAYLKKEDKAELEKKLQRFDNIETSYFHDLAKRINQGDWKNLFEEYELKEKVFTQSSIGGVVFDTKLSFVLEALYCLKSGLISDMTYSSSQLFYNVWTHEENKKESFKPCVISIFNEKKQITQSANKMIDETMKLISSVYIKMLHAISNELANESFLAELKKSFPFLTSAESKVHIRETTHRLSTNNQRIWTKEQRQQFYIKLSKLPPSEQSFLIVYDPIIENIKLTKEFSVMDTINLGLGFNAFSRFEHEGHTVRMIPSRGMMQAWLEAMWPKPKSSPKPAYRFALSPVRKLHNTLKDENSRDSFQSCLLLPETYTPKVADGHPAYSRFAEAELHDFYHQMRIANIPLNDRDLLNSFADKLLSIAGPIAARNKFAYALAAQIIDMEHSEYSSNEYSNCLTKKKETVTNPAHKFWLSLDNCYVKAIIRLSNKMPTEKEGEIIKEEMNITIEILGNWILNNEFEQCHWEIIDSINDPLTKTIMLEDGTSLSQHSVSFMSMNLRKMIKDKTKLDETDISHLVLIFDRPDERTLKGRIHKKCLPEKLEQFAKEKTIFAIKAHFKNELIFPLSCHLIRLTIANELINNYERYGYITDLFTQIVDECEGEFLCMMRRMDPASDQYDKLMSLAIEDIEKNGKYLFAAIYKPSEVNRVFKSDQQTLLHRVLAVECMDLMMLLTNHNAKTLNMARYSKYFPDGSNLLFTPSYSGMSPLELSVLHGRPELIALLIIAGRHPGEGWMEKHPEDVERLLRMDKNFHLKRPNNTQDNEWALNICKSLPAEIMMTEAVLKEQEKIDKVLQTRDEGWEKIKANGPGHIEQNLGFETLRANYRFMQWQKKGGIMPDAPRPK